jgi:hypothetical protein
MVEKEEERLYYALAMRFFNGIDGRRRWHQVLFDRSEKTRVKQQEQEQEKIKRRKRMANTGTYSAWQYFEKISNGKIPQDANELVSQFITRDELWNALVKVGYPVIPACVSMFKKQWQNGDATVANVDRLLMLFERRLPEMRLRILRHAKKYINFDQLPDNGREELRELEELELEAVKKVVMQQPYMRGRALNYPLTAVMLGSVYCGNAVLKDIWVAPDSTSKEVYAKIWANLRKWGFPTNLEMVFRTEWNEGNVTVSELDSWFARLLPTLAPRMFGMCTLPEDTDVYDLIVKGPLIDWSAEEKENKEPLPLDTAEPCKYFNEATFWKMDDPLLRVSDFIKSRLIPGVMAGYYLDYLWERFVRHGFPNFRECRVTFGKNARELTFGDLDEIFKGLKKFRETSGGKEYSETLELRNYSPSQREYLGECLFGRYRYGVNVAEVFGYEEEGKELDLPLRNEGRTHRDSRGLLAKEIYDQYKDLLNLKDFVVEYKGKVREVHPLSIKRIAEFLADLIEEQLNNAGKEEAPELRHGLVAKDDGIYARGVKEPTVYDLHVRFYAGNHSIPEVYNWLADMDWDRIQNSSVCKPMDIMLIQVTWNHKEGHIPQCKVAEK